MTDPWYLAAIIYLFIIVLKIHHLSLLMDLFICSILTHLLLWVSKEKYVSKSYTSGETSCRALGFDTVELIN